MWEYYFENLDNELTGKQMTKDFIVYLIGLGKY